MDNYSHTSHTYFLNILKEKRRGLTENALNPNSNLYAPLFKNKDFYETGMQLFKLRWLKSHCEDILGGSEKLNGKRVRLYSEWINNFLKEFGTSSALYHLLEAEIKILEELQLTDYKWEEKLNNLKNQFIRTERKLDMEYERLIKGKL